MPTPNWKNITDYDFTESLSLSGWAWQFLKRNLQYQRDYDELQTKLEILERDYGPIEENNAKRRLIDVPGAFEFIPKRYKGESLKVWKKRCIKKGRPPRQLFITVAMGKKWGLNGRMLNPYSNEILEPIFTSTNKWPRLITYEDVYINDDFGISDELLTIEINLKFPLKKQLVAIKQLAEKHKESHPKITPQTKLRARQREWKGNLRLLDAVQENASPEDIGKIIGGKDDPEEQSTFYHNRLRSSQNLVNSGYLQIPFKQ